MLLFGALHLCQGINCGIASTNVGAVFMLTYAVSGTIVMHALFPLRSLLLIPIAL